MKENAKRVSTFRVAALSMLCPALCSLAAWAQGTPTQPGVLTNAVVNTPIQFDVSPPLRDLPAEAALPARGVYVMHPPLRPKLQERIGAGRSAVNGPLPASPGPLISATIWQSFEGVGQTSTD